MDELTARLDRSAAGGRAALAEWEALYLLESTESDPEVTEWDDEATIQRKLDRANARKG